MPWHHSLTFLSTKRIQSDSIIISPFIRMQIFSFERFLINVNIPIYCWVITWNLSNSNFIDFTIVHILHNNVIIRYISNDTNMSVIAIISSSGELYDSARDWLLTRWNSLCFCILYPSICIPSPCYSLILSNIPSTIPPCKTTWKSGIFYDITGFQSCLCINNCWF